MLSVELGQPFPKKKERKASAAEGYIPVRCGLGEELPRWFRSAAH